MRDDLQQIGKPVDRGRWDMTPPTMNAYYNPNMNEIVVPAGYLQPPGFDPKGLDAINYGAVGVSIGHEISHGVDDEGAKYAADGRLENWWTPADYSNFEARTGCTTKQYDGYFVEPGLHLQGKLVTGEALGDLGGVNLAYRAYKRSREGKGPEPTVDGYTPDQQFFLAEGQWRGAIVRPCAGTAQRLDRSSSAGKIPGAGAAQQHARVSAGLPVQGGRCHGAGGERTLLGMVIATVSIPATAVRA